MLRSSIASHPPAQIADNVFQQVFIPNTLEDVADFEHDIAMAAKGEQVCHVISQRLLGSLHHVQPVWAVVMGQQADLRGAGTVPKMLQSQDAQTAADADDSAHAAADVDTSALAVANVAGSANSDDEDDDDEESEDDNDDIDDGAEFLRPAGALVGAERAESHKAKMPDFSHLDKKVVNCHAIVVGLTWHRSARRP